MSAKKYKQEGNLNFILEVLESSARELPSCYSVIRLESKLNGHDPRPRPMRTKWYRIHMMREIEIKEMEDCLDYPLSPLDIGCEIKVIISPAENPQMWRSLTFGQIRLEDSLKSYASNACMSNYSRFNTLILGLVNGNYSPNETLGIEVFDKKLLFTYYSESDPYRHQRCSVALGCEDMRLESGGVEPRNLNLYLKKSKLNFPGQTQDSLPFESCFFGGEEFYKLKLQFPTRVQKDTFILTCKLQSAIVNTALAQICNSIESLIENGKLDDSRAGKSWTEILIEYDRTRVALHLALQQLNQIENSKLLSPRSVSNSRMGNWDSTIINERNRMTPIGVNTVLRSTPITNPVRSYMESIADSIPDEGPTFKPVPTLKDISSWKMESADYSTSTTEEGDKTRMAGKSVCLKCAQREQVSETEFIKTLRTQIRLIVQQKESTSVLMGGSKQFFLGQSFTSNDDEAGEDFDVLEIKQATKIKLLDFENEKLLKKLDSLIRTAGPSSFCAADSVKQC